MADEERAVEEQDAEVLDREAQARGVDVDEDDPVVLRYIGNVDGLGLHQPGVPAADLREWNIQQFADDRFEGDYDAAYDWLADSLGWEPAGETTKPASAQGAGAAKAARRASATTRAASRRRGR